MKGPTLGRRKRGRAAPLRCHVVDDHCDALRHIHAAIRQGALPFTGLRMMHWDAHPDLMVTPDMPAATCFCPHDLYDTLETAEGGIAEWILPLVYQGHLSKLWWLRPPWARQFVDGDYRFCVGQVKATGQLRVSSTAPYFVDDRLHCPEAGMRDSKPLHLCVSLASEVVSPTPMKQAGAELAVESMQSTSPKIRTRPGTTTTNGTGVRAVLGGHPADGEGVPEHPAGSPADETLPATQPQGAAGYSAPTPWVLDICLDYFTTENPFMEELERSIGEEDAALVRAFYDRPRFRGAATALPHDVQVEHERIFKSEVDKLLRLNPAHVTKSTAAETAAGDGIVGRSTPRLHGSCGADSGKSSTKINADGSATPITASIASEEIGEEDKEEGKCGGIAPGVERLVDLFGTDERDRLLPAKFASMVGRMGPKERGMVAWTNHCACLPRHSASREEVTVSVRAAEELLRSLIGAAGSGDWRGCPGVVTVARSEGDGYVPSEMVAFVEGEVLTMLARLFGDGDERVQGATGLEVLYDEGVERALP